MLYKFIEGRTNIFNMFMNGVIKISLHINIGSGVIPKSWLDL